MTLIDFGLSNKCDQDVNLEKKDQTNGFVGNYLFASSA